MIFSVNNNNACCAKWLWNIVPYIKGGMQAKVIRKEDTDENIWV